MKPGTLLTVPGFGEYKFQFSLLLFTINPGDDSLYKPSDLRATRPLREGEAVIFLEKTSDEWSKVFSSQGLGWVRAEFLKEEKL